MNFVEAVRALKDGKRAEVKRRAWHSGTVGLQDGALIGDRIPITHDILADDWEIVPKPKVKKVIEGWVNIYRGGIGCGKIYPSKEEALTARETPNPILNRWYDFYGDPLFIHHEYEVDNE